MLSSTAKDLYWVGRYIQRAENTARLLEATQRMAIQSGSDHAADPVAAILGQQADFAERFPGRTLSDLLEYMTLDTANWSSLYNTIRMARDNARAERNNITTDVWEALNGLWLEIAAAARDPGRADRPAVIETVKKQAVMIGGAAQSTLLRDEAFDFLTVGTFIERADNTARILDVKYHLLRPAGEREGSSQDYFQWAEILSCIGALRTYRRVYRARIEPRRVAELMILRHDLPRSLHHCMAQVDGALSHLADSYARRGEADRLAGEMHAELRYGRIDRIFDEGLHEFLTDFRDRAALLSDEIGRQFLLD